jgi:hypothetical protein
MERAAQAETVSALINDDSMSMMALTDRIVVMMLGLTWWR